MAISNVRTGNIHEAAGGLFELLTLSHGETLFVFFEEAVATYRHVIKDREILLRHALAGKIEEADLGSIESIVSWWKLIFESEGIIEDIRAAVGALDKKLATKYIHKRLQDDNVWNSKECPILMTSEMNENPITASFAKFAREDR